MVGSLRSRLTKEREVSLLFNYLLSEPLMEMMVMIALIKNIPLYGRLILQNETGRTPAKYLNKTGLRIILVTCL